MLFIPHRGEERRLEGERWVRGLRWSGDVLAETLQRLPGVSLSVAYGIHPETWEGFDVVAINNLGPIVRSVPVLGGVMPRELEAFMRRRGSVKVTAGCNGFEGLHRCSRLLKQFDAVTAVGPRLAAEAKRHHGRVYLTPESVDHSKFTRITDPPGEFSVGWVGDESKKVKNVDLIPALGFPVKLQGKNNYVPYPEMPTFYHGISALVNVSSSEGFCKPLVEAGACGVPSVSSDVGVARDVVHPELMVYGDPRSQTSVFRRKLEALRICEDFRSECAEYAYRASLEFSTENALEAWSSALHGVVESG